MSKEPLNNNNLRRSRQADVEDERLDTCRDIARYLGVSESYFYGKIRDKMDDTGILFTRGRPGGHRMIYTYKRLVLAWLVMSRDI